MTTLTAFLLALLPTGLGLGLLGLADPKRRRSHGLPAAPRRLRLFAIGLCLLCGLFVAAAAGSVPLLIWATALAPIGWIVTNGMALIPRESGANPHQVLAEGAASWLWSVQGWFWGQAIRPRWLALTARGRELVRALAGSRRLALLSIGGLVCAFPILIGAVQMWGLVSAGAPLFCVRSRCRRSAYSSDKPSTASRHRPAWRCSTEASATSSRCRTSCPDARSR